MKIASGVDRMMNKAAVKIAVSALAIGTTQVSCMSVGGSARPNAAAVEAAQSGQAAGFHARAQEAVQKGDLKGALRFAEQAVEFSPRDAGYRLALGDLYLKNGRFQSAETSFGDVIALDPGNARAGLGLALSRIALGKTVSAISGLDSLSGSAPAADVGLAYALAGQPQRAIEMLEPAARASDASPRIRQNLALAYALAGNWQQARAVAAQDVSPAELGPRMEQWARFAQASAPWSQVASLLGVTPVADEGQPVRLALAPAPAPQNEAFGSVSTPAALPAAAQVEQADSAPAAYAAVEAAVDAASESAPAEVGDGEQQPAPEAARPVYAEAVESLVTQPGSPARPAAEPVDAPVIPFQPRQRFAAPAPRTGGRFVVQLGAFSNAAGVERAWANAYRRYGLVDAVPLSTTIKLAGRGTFHRLSVSGFDTHAEANRVCRQVKAKGGACFVRTIAGDAPTRWAARYTGRSA
jgi:Flp pilus assembly protein TadD